MKKHTYQTHLHWTGNQGTGTSSYRAYSRDHEHTADNKQISIPGSSDPAFRGDPSRYNPEELLLSSLASCHMLWFLHLCAESGVVVLAYEDTPSGTMAETADGGGHFTNVTLYPKVKVAEAAMLARVDDLHHRANKLCFIANSVNFPVLHEGSASC